MSDNQLCWECKNACGDCSWSAEFKPVEGWTAIKQKDSYEIKKCPQFKPDEKRKIKAGDLVKLIGRTRNVLVRWDEAKLKAAVKEKGYKLYIEKPTHPHEFTDYYIRKIKQENNDGKKHKI